MRKLADFARRIIKAVLRLVLSFSAISLCIPRARKWVEVHKAL